jgi:hypothetical protein
MARLVFAMARVHDGITACLVMIDVSEAADKQAFQPQCHRQSRMSK